MLNNINLQKGDIVIPVLNQEQVKNINDKIELYKLLGADDIVELYNNVKNNLNKKCTVISIMNGVLSNTKKVYVECDGLEAVYPIECLTFISRKKEYSNQKEKQDKVLKDSKVNMVVAYYDDKIEIEYCSGKNKYEHLSIDHSKEDKNYNDLVARVHSVALDILNTKLYKENLPVIKKQFKLNNGVKYYRYKNYFDVTDIEQKVYNDTEINCILDKKINNYAETKEELRNKYEDILSKLKTLYK